jgi:GT2 family glycosyltransferase
MVIWHHLFLNFYSIRLYLINIIILNWNSSKDTLELVQSIFNFSFKEYRIIIVDNNSDIENKNILKQFVDKYNNIFLILNKNNKGYTGGNNAGYNYIVKNKLDGNILILNPDIRIQKDTLFKLNKSMDTDVGIVTCTAYNENGYKLYDYIKLSGLQQEWLETEKLIIETDYAAGSCMLINRNLIDNIGLFDNDFFLYWEEVDLAFRTIKNNYKILSITDTYVIRKENSNERSINSIYYLTRNIFLIYYKYSFISKIDIFLYLSREFKKNILLSIKYWDKQYIYTFIQGFISGINKNKGKRK